VNVFKQRAKQYMGVKDEDKLSRTDQKRLRAKAQKIRNSEKKATRNKKILLRLRCR